MAKFNGFESRPETLESYLNGGKVAKFNGSKIFEELAEPLISEV